MKIFEKQSGCTINQFINDLKKTYNINKMCFCGRLDPMARGKVLVLFNDECKLMPQYLNLNKIYQFEICFGYKTDTDDFLGLIEEFNMNEFTQLNALINYINNLSNTTIQKFINIVLKELMVNQ